MTIVTITFDVEDLVNPPSDDIAKDLAELLTERGLQATMMMVGEKVRLLEQRGRHDVIASLSKHDIGLHSNTHSIHPTVAEYLEDCEWEDGWAEAGRREFPGLQTIQEAFGRIPSCWGQPGASWGPQIMPAVKQMGIPSVVYTHTRAPGADVHWYCDVLTYSYANSLEGFDFVYSNDEAFERQLSVSTEQLDDMISRGVPWVGLFAAHPSTVRARTFWDQMNFRAGWNCPPEHYWLSPLKSDAEYATALRNFGRLIDHVASMPGVQVRTIAETNEMFGGQVDEVTWSRLLEVAQEIVETGRILLPCCEISPAETLDLVCRGLCQLEQGNQPASLRRRYVRGPNAMPTDKFPECDVAWAPFMEGVSRLLRQIDGWSAIPPANGWSIIPQDIEIGDTVIGIGSMYRALCRAFVRRASGVTVESVHIVPGTQLPETADTIGRSVGEHIVRWGTHRRDLDPSRIVLYTKLQTWTLKAATATNR